jgi:hypothetical protein
MNSTRRTIVTMAGMLPMYAIGGTPAQSRKAPIMKDSVIPERLVLTDFGPENEFLIPGAQWRGFSDRVMGGVSSADFNRDRVDGRRCVRMTGDVTRDSGGGFIQMALYLDEADASPYSGIELLVYGNDEDYNLHIRTPDCGWHDESYRATFHAESRWQTIQVPWEAFEANSVTEKLDTSRIERIGLLGWMREFSADLAIGQIAVYSQVAKS